MSALDIFSHPKPIIGMVHLLPLPGTPGYAGDIEAIYARASQDADLLIRGGVDGLIVENFGDEPYLIGEPTAAQIALMAAITREITRKSSLPIGLNVQFNAWEAEMGIALSCNAAFIRVEVFVDTVVSAQGVVMPCSAQIRRLQQSLGAGRVQIWADVQTKYTYNLLPQPLRQSAVDACNAGAATLIVTGAATGQATPLEAVQEVKDAVDLPVIVGSGTTATNVKQVLAIADGAIVGSSLKEDGLASNPVSARRVAQFMEAAWSHAS